MSTQKQLLHTPIDVTVNGETFSILPFPWGKQHIVSAKLLPAFMSLNKGEGETVGIADLIEAGGEGIMEITALAVGKPRAWLDTIYDYDEGKALTEAVLKANEHILKKLLPDLLKTLAKGVQVPAVAA